MMIESYTSAQSMRVCQDGTENRLNIVSSLSLRLPHRLSTVLSHLQIHSNRWPSARTNVLRKVARRVARRKCRSYRAVASVNKPRSFHPFSADPFSKKDWYDIKAPSNFETRNIGRTLVTRTTGTSLFELDLLFARHILSLSFE